MDIRIKTDGFKDDATIQGLNVPDILSTTATKAQMSYLLTNNIPFDGVQAYVEVLLSVLDEIVPVAFPNSTKQTGDIDNPTTEQKTWAEYTQYITNTTNAILKVGYHDRFGNRSRPVTSTELSLWIAEYGAANIVLPSEAAVLRDSDYRGE